jgi:hypothetical protein
LKSPVRENRTPGSVRGARGNPRPYLDTFAQIGVVGFLSVWPDCHLEQRVFEHALAGARFAQHQAEAALLGVDAEDVEAFLLVRQEREGFSVEGMALEAEVGADHISVAD